MKSTELTFTAASETDAEQTSSSVRGVVALDSTMESLQILVDQLNEEGEISDGTAIHQLQLHVTALVTFEQQGDHEKVANHLNALNLLVDHYEQEGDISEMAADMLAEYVAFISGQLDS
jgi:poly(A) polymerase Pap1